MLDKMREGSQGIAAKLILGVIILSFALAGVSSYIIGGSSSAAVLVNGEEISQAEVEQAYQTERSNLQQQYGEQFDLLAANPNFAQQVRAQATQKLVTQLLVNQAIAKMGLRIGDEQVKSEIRNMSEFSVDGQFNNELYLSTLRRASYTPAQFSNALKEDLARRQLLQMLIDSEFVMPQEVASATKLQEQQRIAKVLNVAIAEFIDAQEISADDIDAYYQNNLQLFQYPEQVSANYILLDGTALAAQISVSDQELEDYYELHKSDYQRAERRKVAHILIQGDDDAAQQKAAAILEELENGGDFGQLATEKSDDTYSAQKQGELDWFERGVMDPEFEQAAFALTADAPLSGLVESSFGYHIIKLLDVDAGEIKPLSEIKEQLTVALKQEKTDDLYYDLHQKLGEVAFESPDSLDDAAQAIDAEIVQTELFSEQEAPQLLTDNTVLQTLFDIDFREDGLNSDVIDISDKQAIVVRVSNYQAPSTQPLAEVSDSIVEQLQTDRARVAAQAFVDTLMAKLDAQQPIDDLLAEKGLAFSEAQTFSRYSRDHDYQVVEKTFKLAKPTGEQVTNGWVSTSTGDFVIIALTEVVEAETADPEVQEQLTEILTRSASEATYQAFVAQLTADAEITYQGNH